MSAARSLVTRLAAGSREAGTPATAGARAEVAHFLSTLGYEVESQRFAFSPVALQSVPILGGGLGLLAVALFPLLVLPVADKLALAVWLVGAGAVAALAIGVGLGWTSLGAEPREDANLVARRPGAAVRLWLVAHLDTKAQGHSMAGRLVAVWLAGTSAVLLTGLALWRTFAPVPTWAAAAASLLAVAAGALLGRGRLAGASAGARDNASGLLAVLTAAERSSVPGLGIVVTGAEEFGLVGARMLAQERGDLFAGAEVVNIDTVDDRGHLHLVSHDKRGAALARHLQPLLAQLGPEVRLRKLPAGIMVDSLPLAPHAARAVTVARLDWETLRRVHTPSDTLDGFGLETAGRLGRLLARAIDPSGQGG